MSKFSKYRPTGYQFSTPERFTTDEARLNRINAELQKNVELQQKYGRLSRDLINETLVSGPSGYQGVLAKRPKAVSTTAALLSQFKEEDFANPQARADYRLLRAQQTSQRDRTSNRRNSQKVPPSGGDKRHYNPTGKDFASTIYGTIARLTNWTNVTSGHEFKRGFAHARQVLPCIQRNIRKEVMFAKGHAGKGYHSKKRRTWASGVPC